MQIFKEQTKFDFMAKRKLAVVFSLALIVISIGSFISQGLNFGLDFTGGTLVEVRYSEAADLDSIRKQLKQNNYENFILQNFGTTRDVLIRLAPKKDVNGAAITQAV